jgi:chromosomal replication initiation ATPase DnaA
MNAEEAWELVVEELRREMPSHAWFSHVQHARFISYAGGCFCIKASSENTQAWLAARLTSTVRRMLTGMMNRAVEVEFVVKGEEQRIASREQEKLF